MWMSNIAPLVLFVLCQRWYHWVHRGHISWRGWEAWGEEEGWGCTEPLDTDRKDLWQQRTSHTCVTFPCWGWDTSQIFFSIYWGRMMCALTNGRRLAWSHMSPLKGRWLHVDEMEFMLASLRSINNQDERCHPAAAREGLRCLLSSGVYLCTLCVYSKCSGESWGVGSCGRSCTVCVHFSMSDIIPKL